MATAQPLTYEYPNEIFDRVSYYLTSKQKGICQTVCRSWRILFTPPQYRHIQIRGRRQFNQLYNSLASSFVGYYIRRLSVNDVYMTVHELNSLPALCPNLVALSFNGRSMNASIFDEVVDRSLTESPFKQWKYLRRLTELQNHTVTNYLLRSKPSSLSSLTHLSIRFQKNGQDTKVNFLTSLHRASDLLSLSLDSVTLSLAEMEMIHTACPNLQKLRLTNARLEPIGLTVQEKRIVATNYRFIPAKCMKTFEFQNGNDIYQDYEWLYYLSSKYINLVNLELWCEYSVNTPIPEIPPTMLELEERYSALATIGVNCRNLKSLKLFNITMNHWLFEAMDSVGTKLENIALGDMTDNTIYLLQYLGESKQNVSFLTLWGWPSLCIQEIMEETVAMISQCSNRLSSFAFSMRFSGIKNSPMPLDLLLNRCPNLTRIKLDNIQAILISSMDVVKDALINNINAFSRPYLKHVAFENGSFRNEIFEYLSIRCPNLTGLELDSCALIGRNPSEMEIKIHMPSHTFESISINHTRPPTQYHHLKQANDIRLFDVTQYKKNDLRQLYELADYENYNSSLSFHYEQEPVEFTRPTKYINHGNILEGDKPGGPIVSIQCQSLTEFKIGGFWVI